jgi:hypothetical protein
MRWGCGDGEKERRDGKEGNSREARVAQEMMDIFGKF